MKIKITFVAFTLLILSIIIVGLVLSYNKYHEESTTDQTPNKTTDNLDMPTSLTECELDEFLVDTYPKFSLSLSECSWSFSYDGNLNEINISSQESSSIVQIKFSNIEGLGFNGQCFNHSYEEISENIIRVNSDGEYIYLDKKLDFAESGTEEFNDIIVSLEQLGNLPQDEIAKYTYCVNVFQGFVTDSNIEYIDRFTGKSEKYRALIQVTAQVDGASELEKVDNIIKKMKY